VIIRATHLDEWRLEIEAGKHRIITDQTEEYGGTDTGPMSSQLLLSAIASCFGQSVLYVAERMHKEIAGLRLEVEGDKDRKEFRLGAVRITLRADCPQALLVKIAPMAKKYCFVTNSLGVPVEVFCADGEGAPPVQAV
jgi:uncharacterized OsmC-like protein